MKLRPKKGMKRVLALFVFGVAELCAFSQYSPMDSTALRGIDVAMKPYRFKPTQLIATCLLIGTGLIGLESDGLKFQNKEMRDELQEDNPEKFKIDDVTQYLPMVSAYGLQLCGLEGRHDYVDRTIILGTSYLIMGASVLSLKNTTRIERPDCSARNSFPSGHTATAFMGAEFLRREYWDVNPWIGIVGYACATFTGFFRMYNNRHWFTDVIAGAGIGILSVEAAGTR